MAVVPFFLIEFGLDSRVAFEAFFLYEIDLLDAAASEAASFIFLKLLWWLSPLQRPLAHDERPRCKTLVR